MDPYKGLTTRRTRPEFDAAARAQSRVMGVCRVTRRFLCAGWRRAALLERVASSPVGRGRARCIIRASGFYSTEAATTRIGVRAARVTS